MSEIIDMLEVVKRGMDDNIYNFTKDGKCSQCGQCCSNILPMNDKEIRAIHRYIKKHKIKECIHAIPMNAAFDMTCPFLDTNKTCEKCRIYKVRPKICKEFICDSEQRAKHTRSMVGSTRRVIDVREEFFGKDE